MTAPQNAWAHPLGKTLVDAFRETQFWYIQKSTSTPAYDPLTGSVGTVSATIWHCGAAVVTKSQGPHATFSEKGFDLQGTQVEVWIDGITLPIEPSTADTCWYQNTPWAVTNVQPMLESDASYYGYKLLLDDIGDVRAPGVPGSPPPVLKYPLDAFRRVESLDFVDKGLPAIKALRFTAPPNITAPLLPGVASTATAGTTADSSGTVVDQFQWQIGATAGGTFTDIPGATALTYTPSAGQLGQFLRLQHTANDNSGLPIVAVSTAVAVTPVPLTRLALPSLFAPPPTSKFEEGATIQGTPGTAQGGTGLITYASHWELSADGLTGWSLIPGEPTDALKLKLTAAMLGQHVRFVTVATDSTPGTAQTLEIDSAVSPSIAAHTTTVFKAPQVMPVFGGNLVAGATLSVTTDASTAGGVPPITYTYRWQHAAGTLGPWTDVPGGTGKSLLLASSLVGEYIRVVATAVDSETAPGPNRLDLPSAVRGPVGAALAAAALGTLPAGVTPQAGTAFGPAVAGTFSGGVSPVAVTQQWQASADGGATWANVTGATALTITPTAAEVGKLLRLQTTGTDAGGAVVSSLSAASAAVLAAAILCACGEVQVPATSADGNPHVHVYCAPTPAGGVWTYHPSLYDALAGRVGSGWILEVNSVRQRILWDPVTGAQEQSFSPGTQLTYSPPMGVAADWVERNPGEWHNLRTGQWTAWAPGNPGTCGVVIAPSPAEAITVLHAPTPAPGVWTQGGTGGVPTWTQAGSGAQVHQYGDPAVIGVVGAVTLVWLGSGPDPWQNDGAGHWTCPATGQHWPATGVALTTRPQPADTATINAPAGTTRAQLLAPTTPQQFWPAVAVPKFDGTANPTYDPWVLLGITPATWWNYQTQETRQQALEPPTEQWVRQGTTNNWWRQTDGLHLTQARRPDMAADSPADWWEDPAGTWHSTLRSEIYVQTIGNPGTVGNDVAVTAATPKGTAADWTRSGTGAGTDPYVWSSATLGSRVTQPGNPGIAGVIGPEVLTMVQATKPSITGNVQVGQLLTGHEGAVTGGKAPVNYTVQWFRQPSGGALAAIAGATSLTYTPVTADLGAVLSLEVTWTDSDTPPSTLVLNSLATAAVVAAAVPLAAGTVHAPVSGLHVGDAVTWQVGTSTGGQAPVTHSSQLQASPDGTTGWVNVGTAIATGNGTYTLVAGDVGKHFRVVDTITDSSAPTPATVTDTSTSIGPVADSITVAAPTITGTVTIGQVLTANAGAVSGGKPPYDPGDVFSGNPGGPTWQWQRAAETAPGSGTPGAWVNITGQTAARHTIVAADASHFLRVVQTSKDSATPVHTGSANSLPTILVPAPPAAVTIRGIVFGSPDAWQLRVTNNPARVVNSHIQLEWVNKSTGAVIEQPVDPSTKPPTKAYDPLSGSVDYPAFNLHRDATGVFVCGAGQIGPLVRYQLTAADVPGGIPSLDRNFVNTWDVMGQGAAMFKVYQFVNPKTAC
ncbi:MAG: hypothetical protein ACO289_02065 [Prochlorococcaceae cyanobacterium]